MIDAKTIAVSPAAGPDTDILELEIPPITIPPMIPEITPEILLIYFYYSFFYIKILWIVDSNIPFLCYY